MTTKTEINILRTTETTVHVHFLMSNTAMPMDKKMFDQLKKGYRIRINLTRNYMSESLFVVDPTKLKGSDNLLTRFK